MNRRVNEPSWPWPTRSATPSRKIDLVRLEVDMPGQRRQSRPVFGLELGNEGT
jgi:hypothetical protein